MTAPVSAVGKGVASTIAILGALARFFVQTLDAIRTLPSAGRRVTARVLVTYFDIVLESLTFRDVWLTLVKGLVFGAAVGLISAFYGLRIRGKPTEVPIASSRAVVGSIVAIFIGSGLFVLLSI